MTTNPIGSIAGIINYKHGRRKSNTINTVYRGGLVCFGIAGKHSHAELGTCRFSGSRIVIRMPIKNA
jgi:hypothetical protein